ncbi:hypothetical protein SALBM311S_05330 [Streptomyces alboniger]|uniref:hypothetical protein n=1 Tax=Streptomyces sp. NPDC056161 TaxID=3345732 RepID=UPI0035D69954
MPDTTADARARQDRTTAAGLTGTAAVCVVLAAGSGHRWPVLVAAGALFGAVMVYRRVMRGAYAYWVAWAVSPVLSLLLLWAQPSDLRDAAALLALPWAGLSAVVALVLFVLWRSRRGGHLDWVVWHPDLGLLRREQTKRAALDWARWHYREPSLIDRLDRAPELARQRPLYPYADRPLKQADRPQESL